MQPIDALTIKAVVAEIASQLEKARLDKVQQTARDEICLTFRQQRAFYHLLLSANSAMGRICLLKEPKQAKTKSQSAFGLAMRKHLASAQLLSIEQVAGERIVDFVFSAADELGTKSRKVLTAEIMGKHSNLILWDKESRKIVSASHSVTADMSSKREIASGLTYVRPPAQAKPNLFTISQSQFARQLEDNLPTELAGEDFLLSLFTGLGRSLAEEILDDEEKITQELWEKIHSLQTLAVFKPAMRLDLTRYTVLSWLKSQDQVSEWKIFESTNEMVATYYQQLEDRARFNQLRDELRSAIRSETKKLKTKATFAEEQKRTCIDHERHKQLGDLILSNIHNIKTGQEEIVVENFFGDPGSTIAIELNPNLSASQNAQSYYRQFAKQKARFEAASKNLQQIKERQTFIDNCLNDLENLDDVEEISAIKAQLTGREFSPTKTSKNNAAKKPLSFKSSDGPVIVVGRNRNQNDEILDGAKPHEIWLHVDGATGSHVLIRMPSSKQDAPMNTLTEAAFAAAYLSKAKMAGTARVIYTQCRYLKKLSTPGLVRYENEKTLEVDLTKAIPSSLKQELEQHG